MLQRCNLHLIHNLILLCWNLLVEFRQLWILARKTNSYSQFKVFKLVGPKNFKKKKSFFNGCIHGYEGRQVAASSFSLVQGTIWQISTDTSVFFFIRNSKFLVGMDRLFFASFQSKLLFKVFLYFARK